MENERPLRSIWWFWIAIVAYTVLEAWGILSGLGIIRTAGMAFMAFIVGMGCGLSIESWLLYLSHRPPRSQSESLGLSVYGMVYIIPPILAETGHIVPLFLPLGELAFLALLGRIAYIYIKSPIRRNVIPG
jgi:hypothetical protein